jgi:hypothetical protein
MNTDKNYETEDTGGVVGTEEIVQLKPVETAVEEVMPVSYDGASLLVLTDAQKAILAAPVKVEDVDILPTGEIYLSQVKYRRVLIDAFGPGGWSLIPVGGPVKDNTYVAQKYALYVQGHWVSEAVGEQAFKLGTNELSYPTALEGAKSNALMRSCKDLGIATELWDRRFVEKFKDEFCVKVWRKKRGAYEWRRKDAQPFYDEAHAAPAEKAAAAPPPEKPPENIVAAYSAPEEKPREKNEDERFKEAMEVLLKRLGPDEFFAITSAAGMDTMEELLKFVTTRDKRKNIYKVLAARADKIAPPDSPVGF